MKSNHSYDCPSGDVILKGTQALRGCELRQGTAGSGMTGAPGTTAVLTAGGVVAVRTGATRERKNLC